MPGGMNLKIADTVEYNKKPGKPALVKTMRDPAVPRDDMYKSGTIHVGPGESPNSVSRPTPKGKAIARPIMTGKLLRPGGPGGQPSKLASRPRPSPAAITQTPRAVPQPAAAVHKQVTQTNGIAGHTRNESTNSVRAPPPPPPPAAPPAVVAPSKPQVKVKYDFNSPNANELSISAGEILELLQREQNGWWLCKNPQTNAQGWTPAAYVEEIEQARAPPPPPPPAAPARAVPTPIMNGATGNTKAKPTPPAPPVKRPVAAGRKPIPPPAPARDSAVSLSTGSGNNSGRATPNSTGGGSLAGGLAEALRARQSAMSNRKDDDDDDW